MHSFNLPLSKEMDFGVDSQGSAFFKSWHFERANLHLTPDEFKTLFQIITSNSEMLAREIEEIGKEPS